MRSFKFGACYPGYRYCGPGCSGPGKPVNAVDACCKRHDECYEAKKLSRRQCDVKFDKCLAKYMNSHTPMSKNARFFSRAIHLKNFFF